MCAAIRGNRELVEILFPKTRPIPSAPDWSVDGIIRSMKYPRFESQVCRWFLIGTPFSANLAVGHCYPIRNIYYI
jgi:hypothetical protein